jgi:hypothetical protein
LVLNIIEYRRRTITRGNWQNPVETPFFILNISVSGRGMLSTQYRLRLEFICKKIANKEEVKLEDMIWAEKLSKANTTARDWLCKARRQAAQDIQEGSMDDFMNRMGLGDPDPSNHRTGFDGADEIVDWFQRDKPDDWRQRD